MRSDIRAGVVASGALLIVLLCFALSVNFPRAAGGGFKGDEASYYALAHSLARDFDFQFDHRDLERVWQEFPGPEGIFLKHGKSGRVAIDGRLPFVHWVKSEDPLKDQRLYISKSYIYPLVAAPFVFVFGTSGFMVLHALLLSADFLAAYLFLYSRTRSNRAALPMAAAFLGASVVPVWFVWLMPELFNFSLALWALALWGSTERDAPRAVTRDYIAAALLGVLTFSKPSHALLLFPIVGMQLWRKEWLPAIKTVAVWALLTASLYAVNAGVTGEFNYQGGDRKTFYHQTGFPFANTWETFDNSGPVRGREEVMVGDVLVNAHSGTVFVRNILYFVIGRYAGLVPYFFPGVLLLVAFARDRQRRLAQWFVVGTIGLAIAAHIIVWPFTFNGGGGPIGNRYFVAFYPLFLLLTPGSLGLGSALLALAFGSLFTATVTLNPFYASVHAGDHAKQGPLRFLPIELTLLHDLPVAQEADRMKQPLGGSPPMLAYFMDDNAYAPEESPAGSRDYWFWVKGAARADIVLRGAVDQPSPGRYVSKTITRLHADVRNGAVANRVRIDTGKSAFAMDLAPGEERHLTLEMRAGVPYHRDPQPTSYLYSMTISTTNGFVPFLDPPCADRTPGACSPDSRYLGAMIHLVPEYTDADIYGLR